jgi:hypothetical protein
MTPASYDELPKRQQKLLKGSILHKRSIIRRILSSTISISAAAEELGVAERAVNAMMETDEVRKIMTFTGDPTRKRIRPGNYDDLERELIGWIDKTISLFAQLNPGVSMAVIQTKARELNKKFQYTAFTASNGWFSRFCSRFDIMRTQLKGEGGSVDMAKAEGELINLRIRLDSYDPQNVFNMDETALFYRALPNSLYGRSKVITAKDVRGSAKMVAKDRVSLVVCTNATGE